jgi:2-octaprenyl-6-methoxyphenol hydroxylase
VIKDNVDVLIVGGGLTGSTLALALQHSGLNTLLVEKKSSFKYTQPDFDTRSLALSAASVRVLQMLEVWPHLQSAVTPIDTIHVSEQGHWGKMRLNRTPDEALGFVVEMPQLMRAIYQRLDVQHLISSAQLKAVNAIDGTAHVQYLDKTVEIKASLIVAADGTDSEVRALCGLQPLCKDYAQHAIVANIGLSRPHQQQAYERFTRFGPLALLPLTGLRAGLVWALPPNDARALHHLPETIFLQKLQHAFGYSRGRFMRIGQRMVYPLRQVLMPEQVRGRVVFIGNAAHTLHPVAGQGFNLGLRDVAMLAQCILQEGVTSEMLKHYETARSHDQHAISQLTDGLITLFTNQLPGMAIARSSGMMALDLMPGFKHLLTRYTRGFAGTIPDLVCGIPLVKEMNHDQRV